MIVRTYGRRNRSITRSYNDGAVLGSQESSQDVFNFEYSSQESLGQWSDLNVSSEESKEFAVLPMGRSRDNGICEGPGEGFSWKSKKVKIGDGDDLESFGFNSSQESGETGVLPWRNGEESWNMKSSDDSYMGTSNVIKINDDPDPYGFNSLQDSVEFNNVVGDIQKPKKGKHGKGKENGVLGKKKKKKKDKKEKGKGKEVTVPCTMAPTVTLMETQEFGEMMEHMDEVNFALDGLRRGQPVRIRRASLLSLLSICGSSQQRRLLRAHGYNNSP